MIRGQRDPLDQYCDPLFRWFVCGEDPDRPGFMEFETDPHYPQFVKMWNEVKTRIADALEKGEK